MRTSLLLAALLAITACSGVDAVAPEGFAAFDDFGDFRAVSADGVMYRVRVEENDPEATLDFWKEALRKRMENAGYRVVAEQDLTAARPAYLLQLAASLLNGGSQLTDTVVQFRCIVGEKPFLPAQFEFSADKGAGMNIVVFREAEIEFTLER